MPRSQGATVSDGRLYYHCTSLLLANLKTHFSFRYVRHKQQSIEKQRGNFSEEYFEKVVELAESDVADLEAAIIQFLRLVSCLFGIIN